MTFALSLSSRRHIDLGHVPATVVSTKDDSRSGSEFDPPGLPRAS